MKKDKLESLKKYAASLVERRKSKTPEKWAHSPEQYKNFLTNELKLVNMKIDAERLASGKHEDKK